MQKLSRFKVYGYLDNVFVTTVFKIKKAALRYAQKLSRGEVYDTEAKSVIYNSKDTKSK